MQSSQQLSAVLLKKGIRIGLLRITGETYIASGSNHKTISSHIQAAVSRSSSIADYSFAYDRNAKAQQ
jgi:hypothetical protein